MTEDYYSLSRRRAIKKNSPFEFPTEVAFSRLSDSRGSTKIRLRGNAKIRRTGNGERGAVAGKGKEPPRLFPASTRCSHTFSQIALSPLSRSLGEAIRTLIGCSIHEVKGRVFGS